MAFRIGLLGAGRMGRTHLAAISGSSEVAVVGVVEPYPSPALSVLAGSGLAGSVLAGSVLAGSVLAGSGVPVFATLDELLATTEIDAALIVVPTDQHVGVLGQVMAAGLPALCEKPCGLNVAQASNCAKIAEAAGLVLQVAYWRRFVPELVELRAQIQGGQLGEILAVNCSQWDLAPPSAAFRASSGGIFADMGVHEFDQTRWLTGQEFVSLHSARTGGDDPDCAQIVGELDGGSTATISLGRWHPAGDSVKVEVYGTKGTASCWFLQPVGGEAAFHQALRLQAEDFARLVRTGEGHGARPADAIAALKAAEWSAK